MNIVIPTLYYTLSRDYTADEAYKSLKGRNIFDTSFCADAIYDISRYKTAIDWLSQVTSKIKKAEDDLFVICNSELSFEKEVKNHDIFRRVLDAGCKGAEILLGNIDTARDLYEISPNIYWTDVFFRTPFIVIYKSAFEKIANLSKEEVINGLCLEQILASILDYKFISFPFLTLNRNTQLGIDSNQSWYNNITSHYYEGIEEQLRIYNEKRRQFPYEETKGHELGHSYK